MKGFQDLQVWQKAHGLTLRVYALTKAFPREEMFGLTSQLRRAAVSVPSNIAEGYGRNGDAEFNRFLTIAMGSASEVEYQLFLARDLNYITPEDWQAANDLVGEVQRMLRAFMARLGTRR